MARQNTSAQQGIGVLAQLFQVPPIPKLLGLVFCIRSVNRVCLLSFLLCVTLSQTTAPNGLGSAASRRATEQRRLRLSIGHYLLCVLVLHNT